MKIAAREAAALAAVLNRDLEAIAVLEVHAGSLLSAGLTHD